MPWPRPLTLVEMRRWRVGFRQYSSQRTLFTLLASSVVACASVSECPGQGAASAGDCAVAGSTRHTLASVVSVHAACEAAIRVGGVSVGTVVAGAPAFYAVRDLPRSLW